MKFEFFDGWIFSSFLVPLEVSGKIYQGKKGIILISGLKGTKNTLDHFWCSDFVGNGIYLEARARVTKEKGVSYLVEG